MKVELINTGNDYSVDITVSEQAVRPGEAKIEEYNPLQNTTMSVSQALKLYEQVGEALNLQGRLHEPHLRRNIQSAGGSPVPPSEDGEVSVSRGSEERQHCVVGCDFN